MTERQEFTAGSRWRNRQSKATAILYGETGGYVSYRAAHSERPMLLSVADFKRCYARIEHPEAPKKIACAHEAATGFEAYCPTCGEDQTP